MCVLDSMILEMSFTVFTHFEDRTNWQYHGQTWRPDKLAMSWPKMSSTHYRVIKLCVSLKVWSWRWVSQFHIFHAFWRPDKLAICPDKLAMSWPKVSYGQIKSSYWLIINNHNCDWFCSYNGAMKHNNYGGVIYSMKNVKWLTALRVERLYITWHAIWRLLWNMPNVHRFPGWHQNIIYI